MRKILIPVLFCFVTLSSAFAQQSPGGRRMGGANANIGHFYGKLVDSKSNKGIEAASVQLVQSKFDTLTRKRKDTVISGMLTRPNGDFSLENLPLFGSYHLKLTAIGYKAIEQKVAFDLKRPGGSANNGAQDASGGGMDMSQALAGIDKDLGNIKMEEDAKMLENVTVTASRPLFQMGVDRKVFNVDKNIVSSGQTAQDLMKSIPSVNVDIDGNVTLRNAAPQIFVDGRPTTLTLDQIPADAIESVEIITNPSAKYDASGGMAGILNIILRKNRKAGYNGNIRAGIDSRGKINGGGDINIKQGKVNFFASANYNQRKSKSTTTTTRHNLSPLVDVNQLSKGVSDGHFAFGRAGFDYLMDNRNTLSVSGVMVDGKFGNREDLFYDSTANNNLFTRGVQISNNNFHFRHYGANLSYKHNFAKAGKDITADFNYNSSRNDNDGVYTTNLYQPDYTPKGNTLERITNGNGTSKYFTGQADYTNPITENAKLESGVRMAIRDNTNITNNFIGGTLKPGLSNNYRFKDKVYAGYVNFSNKIKTFSYQVGLRAESSDYTGTLLVSKDSTFKTSYPISLFPSVFLTKDLGGNQDIQLNYSRRINRPNFFQLIPYTDISDPQNYSRGNPALKPEFTNSFELSYQKTFPKNNSLLATLYYKYSTDLITRYTYLDKSDSVYFTTYLNANNSSAYGLEVTSRNPLTKWWDMTTNINFYNSKINGANIDPALSNERLSYFAKWNNNFKLPANFSIQFSGDYQSKTVLPQGNSGGGRGWMGGPQPTAQGYINPNYGFDFAVKKEFLKNKAASLTLSVNDIFKTRKYSYYSEATGLFTQDYSRTRDQQVFRLNFSYRFGKMDVSLFKRKNMKAGMDNGQQDMQGMQ